VLLGNRQNNMDGELTGEQTRERPTGIKKLSTREETGGIKRLPSREGIKPLPSKAERPTEVVDPEELAQRVQNKLKEAGVGFGATSTKAETTDVTYKAVDPDSVAAKRREQAAREGK
jgi:hypothetical protein